MTVIGPWAYGGGLQAIVIGDSARNTGTQSIAIGSKANVSGNNSVAIGPNAVVTANNEIYLGNAGITSIGGVVNWTATSDQRFKTDVEENVVGLDFINRLRPVTYHMDANLVAEQFVQDLPESLQPTLNEKSRIRYTGFLAQEVEVAAYESGFDFSGIDKPSAERNAYGIRYAEFTVPLVKSVQELSLRVEELEDILEAKDEQIEGMAQMLLKLESRVSQLELDQKNEWSSVKTSRR